MKKNVKINLNILEVAMYCLRCVLILILFLLSSNIDNNYSQDQNLIRSKVDNMLL